MFASFSLDKENTVLSSACASFTPSTQNTYEAITNLSVTITVSGDRLVFVGLVPNTSSTGPHYINIYDSNGGGDSVYCKVKLTRGASTVFDYKYGCYLGGRSVFQVKAPLTDFYVFEVPSAGTYTYTAYLLQNSAASDAAVTLYNARLLAAECLF